MAQTLNIKIKGRFTSFNELSEAPEGALIEATNIDLLQDSVAQPRRGFDREAGGYSDSSFRTDTLIQYNSKILAHAGATIGSATTLQYLNAGTWTSLETISAPSGTRMKFAKSNENLYYTSSTGIRTISSYSATPRAAGSFKGLDVTATTSATAASMGGTNTHKYAYRVVWLYRDANDNLIFGAPSQREEFTITDNTKGVDLAVTIPSGVTTSWFVQVYRSADTNGTPSDELGLVYEASPTAGQITAKTMTIVDIVPDTLRGATIYTAASQEGLAYQNEKPPMAEDITLFRDCIFYMNTTSKHRFYLTVIATGGSNGVAVNDTIAIGGVTYTAKGTEAASSGEFYVNTAGTATAIRETAKSLVKVINQYASSTVYAYYLSGPDDLPGQILLEERAIGGAAFVVTASRPTSWNPTDIPTSGTTKTSSNDRSEAGIFFSKPSQPEATPLPNFLVCGAEDDPILRGIALRDALYVFKQSGQVYKITGYYPNFSVDKVEDSVKLIAKESPQILNNEIYCLSDQGVTVVGDSTKVISRPIEQEILETVNQAYTTVQSLAFGLAYESDRKYYLFMPTNSSATYPSYAHVYNVFTNSWVKHPVPATAGLVDGTNNLYLGDPTSQYLKKERKNYTFLDYADFGFTTAITNIDGMTLTLSTGVDLISIGDVLFQSSTIFGVIEGVNTASNTVTIASDPGFTVASADILKAIDCSIVWAPATFSNPGIQKHIHTASLLFRYDFVGDATMGFTSDLSPYEELVDIEGRGLGLWGMFPWGEEPWGGQQIKRPLRMWVPRAKQRCSQLTISFNHYWGFSNWQLVGLSLFGEMGSEDTGRS